MHYIVAEIDTGLLVALVASAGLLITIILLAIGLVKAWTRLEILPHQIKTLDEAGCAVARQNRLDIVKLQTTMGRTGRDKGRNEFRL
jgi:hypothetical protein